MWRALLIPAFGAVLLISPAVAETRSLPVPSVTLYPGDTITAQNIGLKNFNGSQSIWRNYVLEQAALEGKLARRTLIAGAPIALAAIKDEDVVKRGIATRAVFRAGGLEITALLMPLASGASGEVIEARNMESGLTISATAMADGSLLVGPP